MTIDINICTKDRPTELYGLLISLRDQTIKDFDVYILDDGSGTNIQTYHFLQCIVHRLRFEGHRVHILRNEKSQGISKSRQKLAEYCIEHGRGEYICRLDDDTVLEQDYLAKLLAVIGEGYDLASGVTPPIMNPRMDREVSFVTPIINRIVLDTEGRFIINSDDCGHTYNEGKILPTHHFRSAALYRKTIHSVVKYDDILTPCGFREEEFFSLRAMLAGFTLGVHTDAVMWHLVTPSGGDRRQEYANMSLLNQQLLNKRVRQWYEANGDFITAYNKAVGINESREDTLKNEHKPTNLIYSREE